MVYQREYIQRYLTQQAEYVDEVRNILANEVGLDKSDEAFAKIKTLQELERLISKKAREHKSLVHTSGAFTLPHVGHFNLFSQAKRLEDILVVSMDSEETILRNNRSSKVKKDYERAAFAGYANAVDYVTFFTSKDAREVVHILKPDIFVKSDEYENRDKKEYKEVKERKLVEKYGGQVILVPRRFKISSSSLAERVIVHDIRSNGLRDDKQ